MKTVVTILATAALVILILYSGVTPWRIVNKAASNPLSRHERSRPNATTDRSGDWMRDPNYRTSLEKTTLVGRPEPAASRDGHQRP